MLIRQFALLLSVILVSFIVLTMLAIRSMPASFDSVMAGADKIQLLDRHGMPLSVTFQNNWNVFDRVSVYEMPPFLLQAFIQAEDKRFYQHNGVDWLARFHALYQNISNMRTVRGASTISEQVVRMLHPRPRKLWSKWLEGWEAWLLENHYSKQTILEFYLNQVPYAANRRGVKQAARYYFDRDMDTLSHQEMLALAVLIRAPSRLDLYQHPQRLYPAMIRLAKQLKDSEFLTETQFQEIKPTAFVLHKPALSVQAAHFVRYVLQQYKSTDKQLLTTLDGSLQNALQGVLNQRLQSLRNKHVNNSALLVVDYQRSEILAWVVADDSSIPKPAVMIDAVTAYRQPGSALKPFLYALALQKGWTAATIIDDSPLAEAVGFGMHQYQNYSRVFYGPVSLREALANSLNIPALKTIQFVGVANYLDLLYKLSFSRLTQHPDFYGDGLALGNAEVSLLELVQAYAALANQGMLKKLKVIRGNSNEVGGKRVFSPEISSLIGNILSDPEARHLEFGAATILSLPVQTAVKTGTSSDYRDSWTVGYNDRYVVGLWMGNLNYSPTDGITGSTGPGLVLRSAFALLNRGRPTKPLFLSPRLVKHDVCVQSGAIAAAAGVCISSRMEYFVENNILENDTTEINFPGIRLRQPSPGLHLAVDPRIPLHKQAFAFKLQGVLADDRVDWIVDGQLLQSIHGNQYLWSLQPGEHRLTVKLWRLDKLIFQNSGVNFVVK
jgi:penicillin-binding protein 1C